VTKNRQWAIHPFIFCIYPIVTMVAHNITEMRLLDALRLLIVSMLVTTALFVLLKVLLRDWARAALVCSLTILLFFSYGHVYNLFRDTSVLGVYLFRHRLLGFLWLGFLLLGCWWIIRKLRDPRPVSSALNFVAACALAIPLFNIIVYQVRTADQQAKQPSLESYVPAGGGGQALPDVYYIILDGYSRHDYLLQGFNYDNSPFLEALRQRGFYIGECSQSNYNQTRQSLVSSLNMDYVTSVFPETYQNLNQVDVYKKGLERYIKNSQVRKNFEKLGYATVAFETGFPWTEIDDADVFFTRQGRGTRFSLLGGINPFELLMIRSSALLFLSAVSPQAADMLLPELNYPNKDHRDRVLFALDSLEELPSLPGPKFVFAHIVSPHEPMVFGPNGETLEREPSYDRGYPDQIAYLNQRMLPIVDAILQNSPIPPIIIIQGDHGARQNVGEYGRLGILNAYYLPGGGDQMLYKSISPVNTFRVLFNTYFGQNYALLDDISYKSPYTDPLNTIVIPNTPPGCDN
jgi:hypothetical protein